MEPIKGFEDYGITSCGRVYSFKRNKFLKPNMNTHGYFKVVLSKHNKTYTKSIHRLVAEAYIPNPENLETVDHIDGNKEHNYVNNLQWLTRKDNCVKSNGQKIICMETGEIFDSIMDAERKTKIDNRRICEVVNKKRNSAGGYTWKRVTSDTLK